MGVVCRRRELCHTIKPVQCDKCKLFIDPAIQMASVLSAALEIESKNDIPVPGMFDEHASWARRNRPIDILKWQIQTAGKWTDDPELRALYLVVLQYHSQRHMHTQTCYKKKMGKAMECRFHYPLRVSAETAIHLNHGTSMQ